MEGSLPLQGDPRRKGITRRRLGVVVDHAASSSDDRQRPRQKSCSPHYFQTSASARRVTSVTHDNDDDDDDQAPSRRRSLSPYYMARREGGSTVEFAEDVPASPLSAAPRIVLTRPKAPLSAPGRGEGRGRTVSIAKQLASLPPLALNDDDECNENHSPGSLKRDGSRSRLERSGSGKSLSSQSRLGRSRSANSLSSQCRLERSRSGNSISSRKSMSSKKSMDSVAAEDSPSKKKSKIRKKKSLEPKDDDIYSSTASPPKRKNSKKSLLNDEEQDEDRPCIPLQASKQKIKKKKSIDPSDPSTPKCVKKKKSLEPGDVATATPKGAKKKKSLEPAVEKTATPKSGAKKKKSLDPKDKTASKGVKKKKSLEPKVETSSPKEIKKKKSLEPTTCTTKATTRVTEPPTTPLSAPAMKKESVRSLGLNLEAPCMYMNAGVDALLSPRATTKGKSFDQLRRRWVSTSTINVGDDDDEHDRTPIAPQRKARSILRASTASSTLNISATNTTSNIGKKKRASSATTLPRRFDNGNSDLPTMAVSPSSTNSSGKKKKSASTTTLPPSFSGIGDSVTMPVCPSSASYSYKKNSKRLKKKSITATVDGSSPSSNMKKKKSTGVPPPPPLDTGTTQELSKSWHPPRENEKITTAAAAAPTTPVIKKKKKKIGLLDSSSWHSTGRIVVDWDPKKDADVVKMAKPRSNLNLDVPCMTMNVHNDVGLGASYGSSLMKMDRQRASSLVASGLHCDRKMVQKEENGFDDDGSLKDFLSPALFRTNNDNKIDDDDHDEDLFESLHKSAPCLMDLSWMKEGDSLPEPSRSSRCGRSIFVDVAPRRGGEEKAAEVCSKKDPPGLHIQDKSVDIEEFPDLPTQTEFNDLDPFLDEEEASTKHRARCDSFDDDDDLMLATHYNFKQREETFQDSFSSLSNVPTVVTTSSMRSDLSSVATGGISQAWPHSGPINHGEVNWSSFRGDEENEALQIPSATASRSRESLVMPTNERNACVNRANNLLTKRRERIKKAVGNSAPNLNINERDEEFLAATRTQKSERVLVVKPKESHVVVVDSQDKILDTPLSPDNSNLRQKRGFSIVKDAFLSLSPKFTPKHKKQSKKCPEKKKDRPLSLAHASPINPRQTLASLVVPKSEPSHWKPQQQKSTGRHALRKYSIGSVTSATTATSGTSSVSWPSQLQFVSTAATIAVSPKRK